MAELREVDRLDRQQARRAFERAADSYDAAAALQQEIGSRLLERMDMVLLQPERILDLGAGTGFFSAELQQRYPDAGCSGAWISSRCSPSCAACWLRAG
jgi:ubiquinone/menaquinone biosynthesis C-methylase UbiE